MSRRVLVLFCLLITVLLITGFADAQQPKRVPHIGYLTLGSPSPPSANQEAFRDGLRQLGYIEGQNIRVEYRYAEGESERLTELAAELVNLKSMSSLRRIRNRLTPPGEPQKRPRSSFQ